MQTIVPLIRLSDQLSVIGELFGLNLANALDSGHYHQLISRNPVLHGVLCFLRSIEGRCYLPKCGFWHWSEILLKSDCNETTLEGLPTLSHENFMYKL